MFGLFKKKKKKTSETPMVDVNQNPLKEGDMVMSLRYEMGLCKVIDSEKGLVYKSVETGKQENWVRMVDASSTFQKVEKVEANLTSDKDS